MCSQLSPTSAVCTQMYNLFVAQNLQHIHGLCIPMNSFDLRCGNVTCNYVHTYTYIATIYIKSFERMQFWQFYETVEVVTKYVLLHRKLLVLEHGVTNVFLHVTFSDYVTAKLFTCVVAMYVRS